MLPLLFTEGFTIVIYHPSISTVKERQTLNADGISPPNKRATQPKTEQHKQNKTRSQGQIYFSSATPHPLPRPIGRPDAQLCPIPVVLIFLLWKKNCTGTKLEPCYLEGYGTNKHHTSTPTSPHPTVIRVPGFRGEDDGMMDLYDDQLPPTYHLPMY